MSQLGALALAVVFFMRRESRSGFAVLSAEAGAGVVAIGLQYAFDHAKVLGEWPTVLWTTRGFPNTAIAIVTAGTVLCCFLWTKARLWTSIGLMGLVFWAVLVHIPAISLAGGAIIGAALGTTIYGLFLDKGEMKHPRWGWLLWSQLLAITFVILSAYLDMIHFGFMGVKGIDKALHLILFGILAFFAVGWFVNQRAFKIIGVICIVSTLEELAQMLSPTRNFDWIDLACTLGGIITFGMMANMVRNKWLRKRQAII